MGKRRRESDSNDAAAAKANFTTVFMDTSLDTHFAMLVSDSDTVSDFKKKIVSEHMHFFPAIGEIKIQALKVKRRSNFYYLPDTMHVWNALQGLKGNWYLTVEASSDTVNVKEADSNDARVRNEVSGTAPLVKLDKPLKKTLDTCSEENCVETEHHANKKRKMRHTEDVCDIPSMKENCTLLHTSSDVRNDKLIEDTKALKSIAPETYVTSELEHRRGHDVPKENARVTSDGNKRKKEKTCKLAVEIHSKIDVEQTERSESAKGCSETYKSEEKEENQCLSLNHELAVTTLSNKNSFDNAVPDLMQIENLSPPVFDVPCVVGPEGAMCSKKRKKKIKDKNKRMEKVEKSTDANHKSSDIKQAVNGTSGSSGLICPSIKNIPEATDEEESILGLQGQDVQMKLLDGSCNDASENIQDADGNGADFVVPTQTNQTLEDAASAEKVVEKIQSSLVNGHKEVIPVEKDEVAEFDQVDKEGKNRKAKKKRKEEKHIASDVKMKDADTIETLPMATLTDASKKNHASLDVKEDQLNVEAAAENILLDSDRRIADTTPTNLMTSKVECKPGQDVPTESLGVGSNEMPDRSARLVDTSGAVEDVSSKSSRKKKKNAHKIAVEIRDNSHVEQTGRVENNKLHTETLKPEENKEDKSIPLNHVHEVTISSGKKASDNAAPNESMFDHTIGGPGISYVSKKKKRKKIGGNSTVTDLEKLGIEQTVNNSEDSNLHHKEEDVQIKLPDCPSKDDGEKVQGADDNEANLVMSTQNSQMVEDVGSVEKIVENAESGGNIENKDKKSKKKRKKVQHIASDASENLPVKAQKFGNEASEATEENSVNLVTAKKKEMQQRETLKKVAEIHASLPCLKEKDVSLKNSGLERSENWRKKTEQQGASTVKKMVVKTPGKKSLLIKPGAIFQDNSDESSDEENGTLYSESRTGTPADSSSQSSDSESESESIGEGELREDTTGNGLTDAKDQSHTGGRTATELENLPESMEVTMDMILRSSKLFKNAKLLASQNEPKDINEYVPESQLI